MRAVRMDDARGRGVVLCRRRTDRSMQRDRLAGAIACNLFAVRIQLRETRRLDKPEARVGRRDQESVAISKTHADVACRAVNVAARKEACSDTAHLHACVTLVHASRVNALVKKSSAPKLPDLSAT